MDNEAMIQMMIRHRFTLPSGDLNLLKDIAAKYDVNKYLSQRDREFALYNAVPFTHIVKYFIEDLQFEFSDDYIKNIIPKCQINENINTLIYLYKKYPHLK